MHSSRFLPAVLSHFSHLAAALLARVRGGLSALLFLLAIFGASHAHAADWGKNYGTSGANSYVSATAVDASGNVYIAGYFGGATLTLGSVTLTKIGMSDAFVAKLDAGGTVVWAKNYGGAGAIASGNAITADSAGNVYLGGSFRSANLSTPALAKIGSGDAYALKLDASGNTLWAKNYGGIGARAFGQAIAADGTGKVYLGGYFQSANLSTPALTKIGIQDAYALKLDASGNTLWAKNFGGSGAAAYANAIAADSSGNVYLGGYFYAANISTPALTLIGTFDAYALKLDASGNTLWAKNYGGAGASAYGFAIAADSSGNVYLGGSFNSANLTTPVLPIIGGTDALIIKAATTASPVTSYSGPTPATGTATASLGGGGANCGFTGTPRFALPSASAPAGVTFPHGLLNFTLDGCAGTVTLAVTYPSAVPGAQYWKYGPTSADHSNHWYTIPASIVGNTMTFSITDGGLGDDDLLPNGTIVDPGGAGVQAQVNGVSSIPTLSEWGVILLAGMLGLFGMGVMRRRS